MSDEIQPPAYPVTVELASGTYTLLAPEGEPSGPRVLLPDNAGVTALNADGGALTPEQVSALQAAVPVEAEEA